ncbi:MAG: hypothetical protein JM58_02340 [Peptococcaceae bacterium BICA1-8]|nr:MAG: hypothetical protein JM58_02340 [Peptococcaceae bacterium BICA1-8]
MRRFFILTIAAAAALVISMLFGQLLGGFYIYNLVVEDNPSVLELREVNPQTPTVLKRKVLRLEPIDFYTIQAGIYQEASSAQACIEKLGSLGLRPFVTVEPPYKIWVGCFSEAASGKDLEAQLKGQGFEVFIGKGLINDRALKFPGEDEFMINYFAPLLGKFDIILNHSMKMFQSPNVAVFKPDIWENMIEKVQEELNEGISEVDKVLKRQESFSYQIELLQLKDKTQAYEVGLKIINGSKSNGAVVNSQRQLLELIAAYHNLITKTNEKLNPN